jgi:hypothetical protein
VEKGTEKGPPAAVEASCTPLSVVTISIEYVFVSKPILVSGLIGGTFCNGVTPPHGFLLLLFFLALGCGGGGISKKRIEFS